MLGLVTSGSAGRLQAVLYISSGRAGKGSGSRLRGLITSKPSGEVLGSSLNLLTAGPSGEVFQAAV